MICLNNKSDALNFFSRRIRNDNYFAFTKFGDTELFCIDRKVGTGGEHRYSLDAAKDLVAAYTFLRSFAYLGDWKWNAQKEKQDLEKIAGPIERPVFYDALLFHDNAWLTEELKEFYTAIRQSKRHKIYVAGPQLKNGKYFLGADAFIEVPQRDAYEEKRRIIQDLIFEINIAIAKNKTVMVLTSCSIMAKIIGHFVMEYQPNAFFIDLGSALDPLFIGNTRATEQDNSEKAKEFFKDLDLL